MRRLGKLAVAVGASAASILCVNSVRADSYVDVTLAVSGGSSTVLPAGDAFTYAPLPGGGTIPALLAYDTTTDQIFDASNLLTPLTSLLLGGVTLSGVTPYTGTATMALTLTPTLTPPGVSDPGNAEVITSTYNLVAGPSSQSISLVAGSTTFNPDLDSLLTFLPTITALDLVPTTGTGQYGVASTGDDLELSFGSNNVTSTPLPKSGLAGAGLLGLYALAKLRGKVSVSL
jgi:hypothetical protein